MAYNTIPYAQPPPGYQCKNGHTDIPMGTSLVC